MNMKYICIVILLLVFTNNTVKGDMLIIHNSVDSNKSSRVESRQIAVSLSLIQKLSTRWEFDLEAKNISTDPVFITVSPIRSDGSTGAYLSLCKEDPTCLELSQRVYSPPSFCILVNNAHVLLKRLEAGEKYKAKLTLTFPLQKTLPPYENRREQKTIDPAKIQFVKGSVGMLPNEGGIQSLLQSKGGINSYLNGFEEVEMGSLKGQRIFEIQTIVSSEKIKLE